MNNDDLVKSICPHCGQIVYLNYRNKNYEPYRVINIACELWGLTLESIFSRCRKRAFTDARCVLVVYLHNELKMTQWDVARFFGVEHSLIKYSQHKIADIPELAEKYTSLVNRVKEILKR